MTNLYIRDDLGCVWTFDGERVRLIDDDSPCGGYHCSDWEDAVVALNKHGYITADRVTLAATCANCSLINDTLL